MAVLKWGGLGGIIHQTAGVIQPLVLALEDLQGPEKGSPIALPQRNGVSDLSQGSV